MQQRTDPRNPPTSLYDLRTHAGFTSQAEIAAQIGVSKNHYGRIERGRHNPRLAVALKLAGALHVDPQVLMEVLV
jgi:transcriptional regulator with XRE-family HTH domain